MRQAARCPGRSPSRTGRPSARRRHPRPSVGRHPGRISKKYCTKYCRGPTYITTLCRIQTSNASRQSLRMYCTKYCRGPTCITTLCCIQTSNASRQSLKMYGTEYCRGPTYITTLCRIQTSNASRQSPDADLLLRLALTKYSSKSAPASMSGLLAKVHSWLSPCCNFPQALLCDYRIIGQGNACMRRH